MKFSTLKRGGLLLLVLLLSASLLAACGFGVPATEYPVEVQGEGAGSLTIVNNTTDVTVCYVYVSPSTTEAWGNDQLGQDNRVEPGQSFTITGIPEGKYDLRANDCDNSEITVQSNVRITAEGHTWTLASN